MANNELLKELRDLTGAGIMDIKAALQEAGDDRDKAIELLRKRGQSKSAKKADREAKEGVVESYIHGGGRVGVLLELNSETDFVSRNENFKALAREIAMHIAAANPLYVNIADVPNEVIEKEREIYREQAAGSGKPADIIEKMIEGKIAKFYEEVCLMEQPYIKEPDRKVKDIITDAVGKLGENIVVRRFARYQIGA